MKNIILFLIFPILLFSCTNKNDIDIEGYKPIYVPKSQAFIIQGQPPRAFAKPGKMYLYQQYIFITDQGIGVHIIDNTTPSSPQKIAYISIPGVNDVVVKNGVLLCDNFTDLVSIDISNPINATLIKRVPNIFPRDDQMYPNFATGYFECVDTTKGYVCGWELVLLHNPKCFR